MCFRHAAAPSPALGRWRSLRSGSACHRASPTRAVVVSHLRQTRRKATGPCTSENLVGCVRCNRLIYVSEPARDLPVSPAVEQADQLARGGVLTHLTIHGERVAAIVPESAIDALRAAEDAEDAAEAQAAMDEPGDPIPWEQVKAELDL